MYGASSSFSSGLKGRRRKRVGAQDGRRHVRFFFCMCMSTMLFVEEARFCLFARR